MAFLSNRSVLTHVPTTSLTERIAVEVMLRQKGYPPVAPADDPIHLLTHEERKALRQIERGAIVRAGFAGALSATASSLASVLAHRFFPVDMAHVPKVHLFGYWGWVLAVTAVASVFEIGFLYFDALRSVQRMASASGLVLEANRAYPPHETVILGLARAALELPNPPKPIAGIDPRRETNAMVIVIASLLYKAKIAATTFVIKSLLRGGLGRVLSRAWLEAVAIPVTAIWNAVVCFYVLREARLRILGPSAVVELLDEASRTGTVSENGWSASVRAVASAVVRTHDFHPNHLAIFYALTARAPVGNLTEPDDPARFLEELAVLAEGDQSFVLRVLVIAAILDGRVTRAELRLLSHAFRISRRTLDRALVRRAVKTFRAGEPVMPVIEAMCGAA